MSPSFQAMCMTRGRGQAFPVCSHTVPGCASGSAPHIDLAGWMEPQLQVTAAAVRAALTPAWPCRRNIPPSGGPGSQREFLETPRESESAGKKRFSHTRNTGSAGLVCPAQYITQYNPLHVFSHPSVFPHPFALLSSSPPSTSLCTFLHIPLASASPYTSSRTPAHERSQLRASARCLPAPGTPAAAAPGAREGRPARP